MNSWEDMAQLLGVVTQMHREAWGLPPAPLGSRSSPAVDAAVDEWCSRLAEHPLAELCPPAELRPWLLARLRAADALARLRAQASQTPPPSENRTEALSQLLVTDWYVWGRDRWQETPPPVSWN